MYFLNLLIICYTSTLLTPVNTYVVLAGNLNDFRSLAKKYARKNLVGQIKAMILENGHKYYKESSNADQVADRTVEYLDESQMEDSYEVIGGFKTRQQPVKRYHSKSAPTVTPAEPIVSVVKPTVLTIDDIVEKVKQRLFQQILDKSVKGRDVNAQAYPQADDSLAYKYFPKKSFKGTAVKGQVDNPVYKSVPMKVIKEEVQFEATYEDTLDKDLKQGQVSPKKNTFVNTLYEGGGKKVRFVKQVLGPANSNQGQQPMQQPSSGQQSTQHSNLEPQLSLMQQPNMMQKPIYPQLDHQANYDQSTIMKQLLLMQQQIEQLNRTAPQKNLKKKPQVQPTSPTILEIPPLNIEAVEGNFQIIPNPIGNMQKTNDGNEDQVESLKEEAEESVLSEETTLAPAVTEPSTKALTVPGQVENEQFTEENELVRDSAGSVENDELATKETIPDETNEGEDIQPDSKTVEGKDNNTELDANEKVHTQEFGNPNAGEPIVEKTYNFDKPIVDPVNLQWPVESARKVMLF